MDDPRSLRRLGATDLWVSPVGLGCWQFSKGRGLAGKYWPTLDDGEIQGIIGAALRGGMNWFDTAEGYGSGESEKALAAGLGGLGKAPGEVVVATKWRPLLRWAGNILSTIGRRIECLRPFPIDLYQIHNPLSFSSVESQMRAMAELVEKGRIRAVGVSNFSWKAMERARREMERLGLPLASNQVRYSLLDRRIESNGVLRAAREHGVSIIAYSPLAQGILSGKFHDDPSLVRRRPGFRKYMPAFSRRGLERSRPVVEALRRIAPRYGATPARAALNWLISKHAPTVVAIPGVSRAGQAADAAAAMDFRMAAEDLAELDRVSAAFR